MSEGDGVVLWRLWQAREANERQRAKEERRALMLDYLIEQMEQYGARDVSELLGLLDKKDPGPAAAVRAALREAFG